MKKKLRQSLIVPEQKPMQHKLQQPIQILPQQNQEILKVSPTTKLPTKFDRMQILHPPEKYEIHINFNVTNSMPINQRPAGSVKYEFDGKQMQIRSNAGEIVKPSGKDLDPVRAIQNYKARKRKKKVDRIKKAYGQN
ncbi:MAG: hypothetical protein Q4G63_03225 [Bacteroidia bacterium]|nr:hypothetical protein [Bacteroidia bacterium]